MFSIAFFLTVRFLLFVGVAGGKGVYMHFDSLIDRLFNFGVVLPSIGGPSPASSLEYSGPKA